MKNSDYSLLKEAFNSSGVYFEKYGNEAVQDFTRGFIEIRKAITTLKSTTFKTQKSAEKSLESLLKNPHTDEEEVVRATVFSSILPQCYLPRYDFKFFCDLENTFNAFAKRLFEQGKTEDYYRPQCVAEEILIFLIICGPFNCENSLDSIIASGIQIKDYEPWFYEDYLVNDYFDDIFYGEHFRSLPEEISNEGMPFIKPYFFDNWFNKQVYLEMLMQYSQKDSSISFETLESISNGNKSYFIYSDNKTPDYIANMFYKAINYKGFKNIEVSIVGLNPPLPQNEIFNCLIDITEDTPKNKQLFKKLWKIHNKTCWINIVASLDEEDTKRVVVNACPPIFNIPIPDSLVPSGAQLPEGAVALVSAMTTTKGEENNVLEFIKWMEENNE